MKATPEVLTAWRMLNCPADIGQLMERHAEQLEKVGGDKVSAALLDDALETLFDTPEDQWPDGAKIEEEYRKATQKPAPPKQAGNNKDPYPGAKDATEDPRAVAVMDAIRELPGLEIEVCGRWVWVSGSTKEHRATLKELGLRFARKKEKWYWRPPDHKSRRRGHRGMPMDHIRGKYGSKRIDKE